MYFSKLPKTLYTLDNKKSVQIVTNISTRIKISDEIKNNLSFFYEYIIKDGETPEMLADRYYDNPQLHWLILHVNEIFDSTFEWPMSVPNLVFYSNKKYKSRFQTHHYEKDDGTIVNGNLYIESSTEFFPFHTGNIIINTSSNGKAVVTSKINASNIVVQVSEGGFITGETIKLFDNANITANITSTETIGCEPITAFLYEDRLNENRRKIKILKPQYLESVLKEFDTKL